jgi:hypothetical protein
MSKRKQYTGLTDEQVIASRQQNGVNVLTPPQLDLTARRNGT